MNPSAIQSLQAYPHLRGFVEGQFDMQVNDVRCMMRLPLEACDLDAGCNFTAVNALCDLIAGASVLFYQATMEGLNDSQNRGHRFMGVVQEFFPPGEMEQAELASVLWRVIRNPLTHALGVGDTAVLVTKEPLVLEDIQELETSHERPAWCPLPVAMEGAIYVVNAGGLYWAFYRMLHQLFAAPEQAEPANQLAQQLAG